MREVPISAKPHHVLRGWKAYRLGGSIHFDGKVAGEHGDSEEAWSRPIEFFDAARACGMDAEGVIWHIPPENVYCLDFEECTHEIFDLLMTEPQSERDIEPLTPSEEAIWKVLLVARSQSNVY